ncbi:MAG: prepilin-type N-terminal cleavage/methylation domain-containing protein [Lentisphaeria bacterium]|nr:prepilin-type N-terminal cleavage/methylation domain-containing protein [Lentisphaeria bacterium]
MRKRAFTMIELMVAMAVLVIMLGFIMQFIWKSQSLWSNTQENARVYENMQVFFQVVQSDLESARTSSIPSREIPFRIGPTIGSATDPNQLSFVSVDDPNTSAETDLCEIHYAFHSATGKVTRSSVPDRTGGGANADWDFYGDTDTASNPPPWAASTSDGSAHTIIEGVRKFDIVAKALDGTTISPGTVLFVRPSVIQIRLELVDPAVYTLGLPLSHPKIVKMLENSRRTFCKTMAICQ